MSAQRLHVGAGFQSLQNDGKFVTANSRRKIVDSNCVTYPFRHLAKQHIPRLVTSGVVDDFEPVKVEQQQCSAFAGGDAVIYGQPHALGQQRPVWQSGEHIVECQMGAMLFSEFARCNIQPCG